MKQALYGSIAAAFSAFLFMGGTTKKELHRESTYNIPEVPTTEQIIKQTALYHRVEKLEKTLDSLDYEKTDKRFTEKSIGKIQP